MLPKKERLVNSVDFSRVFSSSRVSRSGPITLKVAVNTLNTNRFAFVVPTSVSKKAVIRNRIRRRISAEVGKQKKLLKQGFDCVFRVYPGAEKGTLEDLRGAINSLFTKSNLYT